MNVSKISRPATGRDDDLTPGALAWALVHEFGKASGIRFVEEKKNEILFISDRQGITR